MDDSQEQLSVKNVKKNYQIQTYPELSQTMNL